MLATRRRLLLLLLLACSSFQHATAQSKPDIQWTQLNLLSSDTNWKFKPGAARKADFSRSLPDSEWKTGGKYYPGLYGPPDWWPGIGVFRKHFTVPDSLRGKRLALHFVQLGASEIYVDGIQLSELGSVGTDNKNEKIKRNTLNIQTIPFSVDSLPDHVLAIYYSNHSDSDIINRVGLLGTEVSISPFNPDFAGISETVWHYIISLGIVLSFCLFFWFVFLFYPFRLASLFSALLLTSFTLIFAGALLRDLSSSNRLLVFGDYLWRTGFSCSEGWTVLFFYSIYYRRLPKKAIIVAVLMLTNALMCLLSDRLPINTALLLLLLLDIEQVRIMILGIRQKRTGFWILVIGALIAILGSATAIFDVFNIFPWYLTTTQTVLAILTDLSLPLAMALQLAWEFGSANRDLNHQIVNVKELSAKTLAQEQEKQEILSEQNELLERQVAERTEVVLSQKTEIEKQRDKATEMLEELQNTQRQLIQSEKMASLGELTAGIAHEIQNPLNFVNNFSEINAELLDEMSKEIEAGRWKEAASITKDLKENSSKISHHGRRAESIVRGMLQHSRKSSAQKEPVDINALAEEYLRLSYHGMRAKDKNFRATLQTELDPGAGAIAAIPQDLGRVLLNLLSNAFFAVGEKARHAESGFEPVVFLSTLRKAGRIEIRVRDNGNGIPSALLDKIFQPFFTTKPPGQGTGLGLSLSYDIIKATGGDFKVKTIEGNGAEFILEIPA